MGFRRAAEEPPRLEGPGLTSALVGIGFRLVSARAHGEPNIEDTLVAASFAGLEQDDLRTLALLVTWLEVHAEWVNADRLTRLVQASGGARPRVLAFWSAVARWRSKDRRFAKLARAYAGPRLDLVAGADFQISRHGEDVRFEGGPLRVPANVLRDRKQDVLSPGELARRHSGYRARVTMGPSYRADMWAQLEHEPTIGAAELARRAHGSFATGWAVKRDFEIANLRLRGQRDVEARGKRGGSAADT